MAKESDTRKALAEEFIKCLDEERLPWMKNWNQDRIPLQGFNYSTSIRYRGINQAYLEMIALNEGWASNEWMTIVQARKLGYYVPKGTHGSRIEVFKYYDKDGKKKISQEEYYKRKNSEDEDVRNSCYSFLTNYTVFNAMQFPKRKAEIEEELKEKYESDKPFIHETIAYPEYAEQILKNYCEHEGIKLDTGYGNDAAFYSPEEDKVVVPARNKTKTDEGYLQVLCHEIAHSTMAPNRLNRIKKAGKFGTPAYAKEELRAEIASTFLLADLGVSVDGILDNSKAYIQSWSELVKKDHSVLTEAIKEASRITEYVKEKGGYERVLEKQKESERRVQGEEKQNSYGTQVVRRRRGRSR